MRIALIVPEYPPVTVGGGGVVFKALAEEYAMRHDVLVLTADHSVTGWWAAPSHVTLPNVGLIRYPLIPLFASRTSLRTVLPPGPRSLLALKSNLSDFRPSVAHLHGFGYSFVDASARFLHQQDVPFVFTNHGYPVSQNTAPAPIRLGYRLYEGLGPTWTERHARISTVVSKSMLRSAPSGWPSPRVVQNALTPLPPPSLQDAFDLRKRLNLTSAPVISAAGRLNRTKGFDVLLEAIERCGVPEVQCVIAGEDNGSENELRKQAERMPSGIRVLFPGRLERKDLGILFTLSDVVVVPSRAEPFGLVALEALGLGCRVIASAVGELPTLVRPPLGRVVPPADPSALSREIVCAIREGPRTDLEETQMRHLIATHLWGPTAMQYEKLFSEALEAGGVTIPTQASRR